MLGYHARLALRSLRRHKALTALMILAVAIGVGASMTMLTVLHVLSADPIPGKGDRLFTVQIDPRPPHQEGDGLPTRLTRLDADALLGARRAEHQAVMARGSLVVDFDGLARPLPADARFTSADFFAMFAVPFRYGGAWTQTEDEGRARVVVLSSHFNRELFGGANSVGRTVRMEKQEFRVVGVLDDWRPVARFYDLDTHGVQDGRTSNAFGDVEQVFIPFSTSRELKAWLVEEMSCWAPTPDMRAPAPLSPCAFVQLWVELPSARARQTYLDYVSAYVKEQRAAGRLARPQPPALRSVDDWLAHRQVVPADVRLQTGLALGFLLVCLINTVCLLLAKFLRRAPEIGVRRALGASRGAIFGQLLVESGAVGFVGGVIGLAIAWLGLFVVRQQAVEYASLARLDAPMLAATFGLSLAASLVAGVIPAWRGAQVAPALQLKSQ